MHLTDATTMEVEIKRGQDLNELFTLFTNAGIKVISMRNKVNRLEELFVRLLNGKAGAQTRETGYG